MRERASSGHRGYADHLGGNTLTDAGPRWCTVDNFGALEPEPEISGVCVEIARDFPHFDKWIYDPAGLLHGAVMLLQCEHSAIFGQFEIEF